MCGERDRYAVGDRTTVGSGPFRKYFEKQSCQIKQRKICQVKVCRSRSRSRLSSQSGTPSRVADSLLVVGVQRLTVSYEALHLSGAGGTSAPTLRSAQQMELGVTVQRIGGAVRTKTPSKCAVSCGASRAGHLNTVCSRPASAKLPNNPRAAASHRATTGRQALTSLIAEKKAKGQPIGMTRAKVWSEAVEDAFRLQLAGWRGIPEILEFGLPEPDRWPETGFIRKLQTRESADAGERILLYFRRAPECEPRFLHQVKLYRFADSDAA